jgi:hypothetical protein
MLDALSITEAEAAGLSELAALDLAMARDFAKRAQAAEDPDTANDLARSYQRMARSYRQTLALKARLQRDIAAARRAAEDGGGPTGGDRAARVACRTALLRERLDRVLFRDFDPHEHEAVAEIRQVLETRLEALVHTEGFLHGDVDALVERLVHELHPVVVAVLARLDGVAPPPWTAPDPPPIQSSA